VPDTGHGSLTDRLSSVAFFLLLVSSRKTRNGGARRRSATWPHPFLGVSALLRAAGPVRCQHAVRHRDLFRCVPVVAKATASNSGHRAPGRPARAYRLATCRREPVGGNRPSRSSTPMTDHADRCRTMLNTYRAYYGIPPGTTQIGLSGRSTRPAKRGYPDRQPGLGPRDRARHR